MTGPEPTTPAGAAALRALLERPREALVALDFDGTLAPIVDDPEQAFAEPAAVDALAALGERVGTVAVVTGRPARTAVRLGGFDTHAGLASMVVLGQYGVERWDGATGEFTLPPEPAAVAAVRAELPALLAELGVPDAGVENKGRAVGVHTRRLADPAGAFATLQPALAALAERYGLRLEPGRHVLEIRPEGMDKGGALRALVAEREAHTVVFGGDDLGDLPAFDAVRALREEGLHGLLVCSASAEEDALAALADVVVDGPAGLAALLSRWVTRLG